MEQNFHKIDKELLPKTPPLILSQKKPQTKCLTRLSCPQGLRTLKSDAPVYHGCHPAGDIQSNKQSPSDHTDASAWDVHPYKLFLFRQHNLILFLPPKNIESDLGNSREPEPARLGPICTPASNHMFQNLVTTKYLCTP